MGRRQAAWHPMTSTCVRRAVGRPDQASHAGSHRPVPSGSSGRHAEPAGGPGQAGRPSRRWVGAPAHLGAWPFPALTPGPHTGSARRSQGPPRAHTPRSGPFLPLTASPVGHGALLRPGGSGPDVAQQLRTVQRKDSPAARTGLGRARPFRPRPGAPRGVTTWRHNRKQEGEAAAQRAVVGRSSCQLLRPRAMTRGRGGSTTPIGHSLSSHSGRGRWLVISRASHSGRGCWCRGVAAGPGRAA